jgi:hypothetical protein
MIDPLVERWITAFIVVAPIVVIVYLFAKHANREQSINQAHKMRGRNKEVP